MASLLRKAKAGLPKTASTATNSVASTAKPAGKEKKPLTLKERQQQQKELRERLLKEQQQGKAFAAPKLKTKFVSKVKQPVAAIGAATKPPAAAAPAAAAAKPAAAAAAKPPETGAKLVGKPPLATAPKPAAAAAAPAKPPLAAAAKPPLAAAAKPPLAAAAKPPLAAAAKPPLAAAAKPPLAAAKPPLAAAAKPPLATAAAKPAVIPTAKPPLAAAGAKPPAAATPIAVKPPLALKPGALGPPKLPPKPPILPKGLPGAPIVPKPAILPKGPPGAPLVPKEVPKPAILPKGPPGAPIVPKEIPKIVPKLPAKPAPEPAPAKPAATTKDADSKKAALDPQAKAATDAAPKVAATKAAGKPSAATTVKPAGKGPAPKKTLAELLGGEKKGPAPRKTLAELLGGPKGAGEEPTPPKAATAAASAKQVAATAEAAEATAAVAAFAAANPEAFAASLAPAAHLKVEIVRKIRDQNPQIPETALATALKKLPDAAFASLRIYLGERWGQERARLLESSAGRRAPGGPSKEAPSGGVAKEASKVGSLNEGFSKLKKEEAPKKEAPGAGGPKKEEAASKKEAPGAPEAAKKGSPPKGAGAPERQEAEAALSAEALGRKALVAMPKICELKAWQEAAEIYAESMRAAAAVLDDWKKTRSAAFGEMTGKPIVEREVAKLRQAKEQQQQQQQQLTPKQQPTNSPGSSTKSPSPTGETAGEGFLSDFPNGMPQDLKNDLQKQKPTYPDRALLLLQDALDMERLQVLLPLLVEKDRYLALLLRTAAKQRDLEAAAAAKNQPSQKETAPKKTTATAAKKEAKPSFLKRGVPGFLAKTAEPKAPTKTKEEPGAAQMKLFALEVCRLYGGVAQYLVMGAAKILSLPSLPPLDCPLLTVLLRKEEGRFVNLLVVQWLLQQLPARELLHFSLTCSACRDVVDICLRKTLSALPFQAEDAYSDIEYWFNAVRFFFKAACQVFPLDRIKHHRGTVLALKKAKEAFVVTPDGMHASVFITLDRLLPNFIAFCDFSAPMRHRMYRTGPIDSGAKVNISNITLGEFVSEYRKRARVKVDELAWTLCDANCDEDLASFLFLTLLQSIKRAVERHRGVAHFRRVEFLATLGCMVEHRLWFQMEFFWGGINGQPQQRSLFFTLADHFKWVA